MYDSLKELIKQMQEGKKISTSEEFERIINSFSMSCQRITTFVENKSFIQEVWSNNAFPYFIVSRVYDTSSPLFEDIPNNEKIELLSKMMDQEVSVENYEMAAVFRDRILLYK